MKDLFSDIQIERRRINPLEERKKILKFSFFNKVEKEGDQGLCCLNITVVFNYVGDPRNHYANVSLLTFFFLRSVKRKKIECFLKLHITRKIDRKLHQSTIVKLVIYFFFNFP